MQDLVQELMKYCFREQSHAQFESTFKSLKSGSVFQPGYILVNDNCVNMLRKLPSKEVHLIIIDPPYGVTNEPYDKPWSQEEWDDIVKEVFRVLVPSGHFICFGSNEFTLKLHSMITTAFNQVDRQFTSTGLSTPDRIIWRHFSRMPDHKQKHRLIKQFEDILVYYRKSQNYDKMQRDKLCTAENVCGALSGQTNVWEYYKDDIKSGNPYKTIDEFFKKEHGNKVTFHLKPEALLRKLIRAYSSKNHVVMDFCMRRGATGIAALQEQRRFIGCDLDKVEVNWATKIIKERFPFGLCQFSNDDDEGEEVEDDESDQAVSDSDVEEDDEEEEDEEEDEDEDDTASSPVALSSLSEDEDVPQSSSLLSEDDVFAIRYDDNNKRLCGAREPGSGKRCTFLDKHNGSHSFEITTKSRKRPSTGQYTEDVDNEIKVSAHSSSNDKCKATKNVYTTVLDDLPREIIRFNQYIEDIHHEDSAYSKDVMLTKNGCFRVGHWRSDKYIGIFANEDVAKLAAILAFDNLFRILGENYDTEMVFDMLKDLAKGNEKRQFYKRLYNVKSDLSLQDFSQAWEMFNSWPNKPDDGRVALKKFINIWESSELKLVPPNNMPPNILRTTEGLKGPRSKNFVLNMLDIKPIDRPKKFRRQ